MNLYDAHSHLHFSEYNQARRDFQSDGKIFVCASSAKLDDFIPLKNLKSANKKNVKIALGIHPRFIDSQVFPETLFLNSLQGADAIGEIGLDKKCAVNFDLQREYFLRQLDVSKKMSLPCAIHCVGAWGDLLACLNSVNLQKPFLIHAANCSLEIAQILQNMGAMFSFGLRELKSKKGLACIESLPVNRILVETDGASKREDLAAAMELVSKIKKIKKEKLAEIFADNFTFMFGL